MFGLLNRRQIGKKLVLTLNGMHCASCSLTIDDTLEEIVGVTQSRTSYAQSRTIVYYDAEVVSVENICSVVEKLGYTVTATKE